MIIIQEIILMDLLFSLSNIFSKLMLSKEKRIANLVHKILNGQKIPELTIKQIEPDSKGQFYKLDSINEEQALILTALKIVAKLKQLENVHITCKVV